MTPIRLPIATGLALLLASTVSYAQRESAKTPAAAIHYRTAPSNARLGNADVGDIGRRVTVMVECYR